MIWQNEELISPFSGKFLQRDSPHSFSDGARRFPVVDEIPFLRARREELAAAALAKLDAGDERGALILLLQDQDDWSPNAPPENKDLLKLLEERDVTLNAAMRCLNYGAVTDYFAYRWSDPTFLSGLKLLETAGAATAEKFFELACGIGHFLRELIKNNKTPVGGDVVFSKLWLARRFVAPQAKLVCFDANFAFPFQDKIFDTAFCHDAFYFLPEKKNVAAELHRVTTETIVIGHAHNANAENFSSGAAVGTGEYAELFGTEEIYDDAELTAAYLENRSPQPQPIVELQTVAAVSLISDDKNRMRLNETESELKLAREKLRVNPLFVDENGDVRQTPQYPSERYGDEYAALSGYLKLSVQEAAKLTNFAPDDFTEREIIDLMSRRILLDLPEKW